MKREKAQQGPALTTALLLFLGNECLAALEIVLDDRVVGLGQLLQHFLPFLLREDHLVGVEWRKRAGRLVGLGEMGEQGGVDRCRGRKSPVSTEGRPVGQSEAEENAAS